MITPWLNMSFLLWCLHSRNFSLICLARKLICMLIMKLLDSLCQRRMQNLCRFIVYSYCRIFTCRSRIEMGLRIMWLTTYHALTRGHDKAKRWAWDWWNIPNEKVLDASKDLIPRFADFSNDLVCDVIPEGLSFQQPNKFMHHVMMLFWYDPYLFKIFVDGMINICVYKV